MFSFVGIMNFRDLKLNPQLIRAIEEKGYKEPTEIQKKAIPSILGGQDLIGIAQTGTGKTAAYVLPILMKLKYARDKDPRALILAPTRELAIQINDEIESFCSYLDLRHLAVYGGTGINPQADAVAEGIDILVATPGRLLDIFKKGVLSFKQVKTLVLDEADRMMDMGFMPQINRVLELVPMKKQCLLFSATFPPTVEKLSEDFVAYPVKLEVSPQASTADTIEQFYYKIPNIRSKINLLSYLLEKEFAEEKVIIFCRTKKNADDVYKFIHRKMTEDVKVIHANKGQNTRLNSIRAFREGEVKILVATDVSARGIDISDVAAVINFNIPVMYEDYVHRVGRTGRAKKKGVAISMCNKAEIYHLEEIEKLIRMKVELKELPEEVEITETPFDEKQEIDMEIDRIRRKRDPDFKGAFHEKQGLKSRNKGRKR